MRVNLITNTDSIGLWQDVCVIRQLLESISVDVNVINNFSRPSPNTSSTSAELSIFLESLHNADRYLHIARSNWLITNPEWHTPDFDRHLPLISLVLCKTPHAYRVWNQRVGPDRCLCVGFESRDMFIPGTQKIDSFIHVAGKSDAKGANVVAQAWRMMNYQYPLTVVTCAKTPAESQVTDRLRGLFYTPYVRLLHNISDEQLAEELSLHRFMIQPSLYEGYGHCIHEGFSAGCVVITTDAPPMNEFPEVDKRMLIPVSRRVPRMIVEFNYCEPQAARGVVESAVRMRTDDLDRVGARARRLWEQGRDDFRKVFTDAIQQWEQWI